MDLKEQIKLLLSYEVNKQIWKNEHNSKEWLLANEVATVVMKQGLNRTKNCGCLNELFYMLKTISQSKIELKMLQMENEFEIKPGILLFLDGTHYSNANITDKKAIEILKRFPVKINAFVRFPKEWKELTKDVVKNDPTVKPEVKSETTKTTTTDSKELESLTDSELRILCDKLAEQTEGLKKVHYKAGTEKMVEYLLDNKVNG